MLPKKSEVISGGVPRIETPPPPRRERNFPTTLELNPSGLSTQTPQPVLIIQSPKTPTLSRKLKAVSLDSDPKPQQEISRDVYSMPNTPKKQSKKYLSELEEAPKTLAPSFTSNLKRFASNNSISGSQTLKTLPEIMTLQDFSDSKTEPVRIKAKGLLERRGSNASLTIDLGATEKPQISRLNTAKSVSNLNLTTFGGNKCECTKKCIEKDDKNDKIKNLTHIKEFDRRKSQTHLETCGNCTIYESIASKSNICKSKYRKCNCICNFKCGRKSLSNENLYVPPCNFCQSGAAYNLCTTSSKHCKGHRRACYPRQADLEASQLLSEDFKTHLQNVQYLQTASSVLSVDDLKQFSERVPKLHQEFWEVPLNLQEKCLVSGSQTRNRYRGVLPNEHSRVHLSDAQPYIHANFIKGPDYTETAYIATQGPMAHTCEDFWEMIWLTKCNCVVMLTQLVEKGRHKCELYFPLGRKEGSMGKSYYLVKTTKVQDKFSFDTKNTRRYEEEMVVKYEEVNEVRFGAYRVRFLCKEVIGDFVVRQLSLEKGDVCRRVSHYWYPNWQDHKMAEPGHVLELGLHVLDFLDNNKARRRSRCADNPPTPLGGKRKVSEDTPKSPLTVHCSAGIGRTGCFLAVLNGIQQLRSNFNVDILAILCSLRLHRGGMVQTAEQYELVHRVLGLYAENLNKI